MLVGKMVPSFTSFDGICSNVGEDCLELLRHESCRDGVDAVDLEGILGGD